jgi:hypothetical protein
MGSSRPSARRRESTEYYKLEQNNTAFFRSTILFLEKGCKEECKSSE